MDLSHPEYAVLGENRARILYRLAVLAEPTSGRRIHHLSGVASLRTTQRILGELVDVGLVDVQAVGAANAYTLNRAHVLWSPIEQVLAVPAATESEIAEIVSAAVRDHAVATAIYGSYARGEAGPESDIDILVVWEPEVSEDQAAGILDAVGEQIRKLTGNRAQLFPVSREELDRLIGRSEPFIESLRKDARTLTGIEIKRLLGRSRR